MENEKKTYPEGHFVNKWMGIGMVMFAGVGVPLSIATDNNGLLGIGPALGMSVGLAIGAAVEEKYKKEGLIVEADSTKASQKRKIAIAITIIGIAIAALIIFAV